MELKLLRLRVVRTMPELAEAGEEVNDAVLQKLADDYLLLLQSKSADALRVVDKIPGNFMFLGLILAAFPNARIIIRSIPACPSTSSLLIRPIPTLMT